MKRRDLFFVAAGALTAPASLLFGPWPTEAFERKLAVAQLMKKLVPSIIIDESVETGEVFVSANTKEIEMLCHHGLMTHDGIKSFRALRKEWLI